MLESNHKLPQGRKKREMERGREEEGSVAVREGNFLHC